MPVCWSLSAAQPSNPAQPSSPGSWLVPVARGLFQNMMLMSMEQSWRARQQESLCRRVKGLQGEQVATDSHRCSWVSLSTRPAQKRCLWGQGKEAGVCVGVPLAALLSAFLRVLNLKGEELKSTHPPDPRWARERPSTCPEPSWPSRSTSQPWLEREQSGPDCRAGNQ